MKMVSYGFFLNISGNPSAAEYGGQTLAALACCEKGS